MKKTKVNGSIIGKIAVGVLAGLSATSIELAGQVLLLTLLSFVGIPLLIWFSIPTWTLYLVIVLWLLDLPPILNWIAVKIKGEEIIKKEQKKDDPINGWMHG